MIVCIAEKPSVARDIAKVLGANTARDGYTVSIITTFLTPYMIKGGVPLFHWIEKKVPDRWKNGFESQEPICR